MLNYKSCFVFLILFVFTYTTSCKKYLDEKPDSKLAVPSTLSDLQALLDFSFRMNLKRTPTFGEASSDDYFLLDETYNNFDQEKQQIYTWSRNDYNFQNDWSIAYEPVYNSNFCLETIDNIPLTASNADQWNTIKGSALFFRSYYFLQLMWVYAKAFDETTANTDLGIVLRLNADFNIPSVRSSVKDCYERISNDAKQAALHLPDHPSHPFRPSKASAYGLLSRAYLSMRIYDSALLYADRCLQIKNTLMDFNADTDVDPDLSSSVPFKRFNKETIFYTEMNATFFINDPYYAKVDTTLYNSYPEHDLRKTAYYKPNSGFRQFKGNYTGDEYFYFTGIATDEVWLIRAEAHARVGSINEAMNDLNTLLKTRWKNTEPYTPYTAASVPEALAIILSERRKELHGRGLRWMDIKRLNKEAANITLKRIINGQVYSLAPNASYYALPLPADIIQLTGIPQN
ncbi:RagB/SusD family nutrient uptake outer membrane protein [Terrimonas alba]|uniref:RagB/SusD family nutrient uptake outer membrane protein n=1 Tax=Terrimonas alba TaxID=3349636 RepID=UPI0035F2B8F5